MIGRNHKRCLCFFDIIFELLSCFIELGHVIIQAKMINIYISSIGHCYLVANPLPGMVNSRHLFFCKSASLFLKSNIFSLFISGTFCDFRNSHCRAHNQVSDFQDLSHHFCLIFRWIFKGNRINLI